MECTSRVDKRSRVAMRAVLALTLAVVACNNRKSAAEVELDADEAACARKDLAACERKDTRLLAECEAKRDGYLCTRAAEDITKNKGHKVSIVHYERACELGNTLGCSRAAAIHAVEKDHPKAQLYFEKGCKLKDAFACDQLGRFYLGEMPGNPPKDPAKAKGYFLRACELKGLQAGDCDLAKDVDRKSR